jgi:hypothetical protein
MPMPLMTITLAGVRSKRNRITRSLAGATAGNAVTGIAIVWNTGSVAFL